MSFKNLFNKYTLIIPISIATIITYNKIKKYIYDETQNIIIEKVNNDDIHKQIHNNLVTIIANIKDDPIIHRYVTQLINTLILENDELKDKIIAKLIAIIKSDEIQTSINELINKTIDNQLKDKKNIILLSSTFYNVLSIMTAKMLLTTKNYIMFWNN